MRVWAARVCAWVCLLALVPVGSAMAATSVANGSPGQGLEISPPLEELSANPGQTLTLNIMVRDVTSGELIATAEADDFGAGSNELGQPQILLNETGATRYSLKYWISPVGDFDLQPEQLRSVPITIKVPLNAEPGGHYGLVRFTAEPPNLKGTGVALSASVGSLILLTVNGNITHKLSVVQFSVGQNNVKTGVFTDRNFFNNGPMDFLVRISNSGTVHEQPTGEIAVTDMLGTNITNVAVNEKMGNILPASIRRFVQTLDKKALFGYFNAKLTMSYASGKTLTASLGFWVIPWKLVLIVIVVLVIVFFLLRLALRKYNEHIIAQARRR